MSITTPLVIVVLVAIVIIVMGGNSMDEGYTFGVPGVPLEVL